MVAVKEKPVDGFKRNTRVPVGNRIPRRTEQWLSLSLSLSLSTCHNGRTWNDSLWSGTFRLGALNTSPTVVSSGGFILFFF